MLNKFQFIFIFHCQLFEKKARKKTNESEGSVNFLLLPRANTNFYDFIKNLRSGSSVPPLEIVDPDPGFGVDPDPSRYLFFYYNFFSSLK